MSGEMRPMDEWTDRLSEYLDDELSPEERAALERHLDACADCTRTLTELDAVRRQARALAFRATPPEHDLWPGIAARIGAGSAAATAADAAGAAAPGRGAFWRRRISLTLPQLAAAAAVVVLASGLAVGLALRGSAGVAPAAVARGPAATTTRPAASAASGAAAASGARLAAAPAPVASATPELDRAVSDLEHTLALQKDRLDPATAKVLQQNLAVIDTAIAQIRAALAADPGDFYLNRSLAETMERKLDVLRLATRLSGAAS